MFLIQFKRVIIAGGQSFWRNGWLSGATIGMMVLTLFTITSLLFIGAILNQLLISVQDKVDISVYFSLDATETEILGVKDQLEDFTEVKEIEYTSRDKALENFKIKHRDNAILQEGLKEIGDNPLQASLSIKAKNPAFYASIASFLESSKFQSVIDKVNFGENELVINRVDNLIKTTRKLGFLASLVLASIAILVTFNTIRLAIYSNRQELEIMRLVGASNWFVRGPYVIEGIIYGIFSTIILMLIAYPAVFFLGPKLANFIPFINLVSYFNSNLGVILLINLVLGIGLGIFSSLVAVRKYLKV